MKVTRRIFVAGSLGSLAAVSLPTLARPVEPAVLLVADPALIVGAPALGTIIGSGNALLSRLLPLADKWHRIEAILGDADMEMLAQIVRFQPGLRWSCDRVEAGLVVYAGVVRHAARLGLATRFPG
jgi:hypothetical protein